MTGQQAREKLEAVVESCVGDGVTEVLDAADVYAAAERLKGHVEACEKVSPSPVFSFPCGDGLKNALGLVDPATIFYCDKAPRRDA